MFLFKLDTQILTKERERSNSDNENLQLKLILFLHIIDLHCFVKNTSAIVPSNLGGINDLICYAAVNI